MEEKGQDQLKPVFFAAGTAALMACIQRAVVVSVFVHWRVWAFLVLNLLLLAILFISRKSSETPSNQIDNEDDAKIDLELNTKKNKKQRRQENIPMVSSSGGGEEVSVIRVEDYTINPKKNIEEDDGDEDQLSKEELNQKVEAFIAMFRQHLVSDAKGKAYEPHYRKKCVPASSGRVNSPRRLSFSHSSEYIYT